MKKCFFTIFSALFAFSTLQAAGVMSIKSEQQFNSVVQNSGKKTIVDMYINGCPPCKALAPQFEKWAKNNASKANFIKVNGRDLYEIAKKYDVRSYPTLLVFDENGNFVDKKVGPREINPFMKKSL
jgi:thiol-disulfide isomerase/thioredoxin